MLITTLLGFHYLLRLLKSNFMRKNLSKTIKVLPVIMQFSLTICSLLSIYFLDLYSAFYYYFVELLSPSLLTTSYILASSYFHRFCLYHRVSSWTLFLSSVLNLIALNIFTVDHYQLYTYLYGHFILIPTTIICTYLLIKKI